MFSANAQNKPEEDLGVTEKLILSNPDSAFYLIQRLRKKSYENGDKHALAVCFQQLGRILHNQGGYPQALTYYLHADKIFRKEQDQLLIARNLDYIGQTYSSVHLKQKALVIYKEALQIFQKLGDLSGIARTYSILGKLYERKDTYDISSKYQHLALRTYLKSNDSSALAKVYNDMGSIYERKGQYETAFTYFNRALSISTVTNNRLAEIGILNNIGDYYRKTGRLRQAIGMTLQARDLAAQLKNKRQLISACDNLAETYKLLGNIDSAFYFSEKGNSIYHETFKEESNKQINLLQTLFEVEKKDHEILQLKNNQRITMVLYGAIVLVLLLSILLFYNILSKRRLESRNEKLRLEAQASLMERELKNKFLEREQLNEELDLKRKELTTHTLHIIQKNQLLERLKNRLNAIVKSDKRDQRKEIRQVVGLIEISSNQDKNWQDFRVVFEQVHTNFFTDLKKHNDALTASDLRLLALLKMNLNAADIATIIGISSDSVRTAKHRLRQKLQLAEGESITSFIEQF